MEVVIIFIFIIGYTFITIEHPLKLDKTVPALLMGSIMWAILSIGFNLGWFSVIDEKGLSYTISKGELEYNQEGFLNILKNKFSATAEILIFLIGAMTIVELIDLHKGFDVIKKTIKTTSKIKLLWLLGIIGFVLSSIIDNLTATIVLITVLRKLIHTQKERIWYASFIVIATNAGGCWSPIGDVTTTMLWIGQKVTAIGLMKFVILPAITCFLVPFLIASKLAAFKGNIELEKDNSKPKEEKLLSSSKMLFMGLGSIVFVPFFKTITHLPPYLGMIFSLGIVWLYSEYINPKENFDKSKDKRFSVNTALSRIEISSILFFLGILMAVGCLESLVYGKMQNQQLGSLRYAAESLSSAIPNIDIVIILLGMLSSIIDNVPLVAASIGMYTYETENPIWYFIAYCAGNGGSMLIIGSAAGVAAMGMEKIDFIWYCKKISWLAFLGFISGAIVFIAIEHFIK